MEYDNTVCWRLLAKIQKLQHYAEKKDFTHHIWSFSLGSFFPGLDSFFLPQEKLCTPFFK